jgi:hypothetical protein
MSLWRNRKRGAGTHACRVETRLDAPSGNDKPLRRTKLRLTLLLCALSLISSVCLAQSAADLESDKMNRVAKRLQCNCGCNMDMTCRMEPYMCGTCKRFKTQIYDLQQKGKSDDDIVAQLAGENGKGIIATHPGSIGSVLSYTGLGVGLLLILFFFRRYWKAPATESVDPAVLNRYQDQIEKETSKFD